MSCLHSGLVEQPVYILQIYLPTCQERLHLETFDVPPLSSISVLLSVSLLKMTDISLIHQAATMEFMIVNKSYLNTSGQISQKMARHVTGHRVYRDGTVYPKTCCKTIIPTDKLKCPVFHFYAYCHSPAYCSNFGPIHSTN